MPVILLEELDLAVSQILVVVSSPVVCLGLARAVDDVIHANLGVHVVIHVVADRN